MSARHRQSGSILIEYTVWMPLLIGLLLGTYDLARLALIDQKVHRIASSLADYAAQARRLDTDGVADLFTAARAIAEPYDVWQNGRVIISVIAREGSNDWVRWQRGDGSKTQIRSELGLENSLATLPDGFTVRSGEPVVAAEVFFDYRPIFLPDLIGARRLTASAYFRPRAVGFTFVAD